jgi:zinc/manganese transport system substrate-binding protein
MMRTLAMLVAAAAALAPASAPAQLSVFACEAEWAALAGELGGQHVDVYAATNALQDVHAIQARPSLIAKWRRADLAVCTGADLEIGWLPALAQKGNNPRVNPGSPGFFEASAHVRMLEVPETVDRAQGDVHPYGNPHIHTDPRNIAAIGRALAARLAELDPDNADAYAARHADFAARWDAAMGRWAERGQPLAGVPVISGQRAWSYLYAWLGIREIATLEPKPGIPPSGAHLEALLDTLENQPARMIVYAAYQDRRPVDWMARRVGLPTVQLPFSPGGAPGTDDLFGYFEVTLDRLLEPLADGRD